MKNCFTAVLLSCLLGGCFNASPKTGHAATGSAVNQNLYAVAKEINKKCPMPIDENTRMDSASVYNEFMITYHYTVHTISNKEVDLKKFKTNMETAMAEKYTTDPQLAVYRDNKIAVAYDYKDKAGDYLCYFICGGN